MTMTMAVGFEVGLRTHTLPELMSSGCGVLGGISGEWSGGKECGAESQRPEFRVW